jgi:hypothetical protein
MKNWAMHQFSQLMLQLLQNTIDLIENGFSDVCVT